MLLLFICTPLSQLFKLFLMLFVLSSWCFLCPNGVVCMLSWCFLIQLLKNILYFYLKEIHFKHQYQSMSIWRPRRTAAIHVLWFRSLSIAHFILKLNASRSNRSRSKSGLNFGGLSCNTDTGLLCVLIGQWNSVFLPIWLILFMLNGSPHSSSLWITFYNLWNNLRMAASICSGQWFQFFHQYVHISLIETNIFQV